MPAPARRPCPMTTDVWGSPACGAFLLTTCTCPAGPGNGKPKSYGLFWALSSSSRTVLRSPSLRLPAFACQPSLASLLPCRPCPSTRNASYYASTASDYASTAPTTATGSLLLLPLLPPGLLPLASCTAFLTLPSCACPPALALLRCPSGGLLLDCFLLAPSVTGVPSTPGDKQRACRHTRSVRRLELEHNCRRMTES
jgi:hypothetical protein